jgi:hypothetical protein
MRCFASGLDTDLRIGPLFGQAHARQIDGSAGSRGMHGRVGFDRPRKCVVEG